MERGTHYKVSHTGRIAAPAKRVYDVIADYRDGHQRILPPQFQNLVVERGGRGAGTQLRFQMKAYGRTQHFRHEVIEPEPGRILIEKDPDHDSRTTFIVDPVDGGASVTISTDLPLRPGLAGRIERFMATRYLLGIYKEEIRKLEAVARS